MSNAVRALLYFLCGLWMFAACTQTPTNPYDCSNTKASVMLRSSNKNTVGASIKDTVGDSISFGFNTNLSMNIDSVLITKSSASNSGDSIVAFLKNVGALNYNDTVWQSLFLSDTGTITIKGTAYRHCGNISMTVTVISIARPLNHAPKLVVPHQINIHSGDICSLVVVATDLDSNQNLVISKIRGPSGSSFDPQSRVFTWTTPKDFIGIESVIFRVTDNGYPPLSDSQTVYINVQTSFSIIYKGNGSTGGAAPVDTHTYVQGAKVVVLGNTGALLNTGNNFAGWNTKADGSGASFSAGDTLTVGPANDTLFAKWTPTLNTSKAMTEFGFTGLSVTGTITESSKTISATVPCGTNLTALVATFTTTGASVKVGSTVQTSAATANNFSSPVTYTVTAVDGTTADYVVTVTVASKPATPTNIAATSPICAGSTSTLTATNPTSGTTLHWYTGNCGGTEVGTGASVISPALTSSTTFYVRAESSCNSDCAIIAVTVNQPAGTPTGNPTPSSVCLGDGQQIALSANGFLGTGGSWVWYMDKTTKVTSPFTPTTAGTFIYYVRSEEAACGTGPWSSGVQVTVNQPAGTPTGSATPPSVCYGDGHQVTLSASGTPGTGGSWVWYLSNKTTPVTATTFTPTSTATYYVRSENAVCGTGLWSSPVTVTVNNLSVSPTAGGTIINQCVDSSILVTASSCAASYTWYADQFGGGAYYAIDSASLNYSGQGTPKLANLTGDGAHVYCVVKSTGGLEVQSAVWFWGSAFCP